MEKVDKNILKITLEALPFVNWDRFVETANYVQVYGWIPRNLEKNYFDFIVLNFKKSDGTIAYITSADQKHDEIERILYKKPAAENKCQRVEDHFNIKNQINLSRSDSPNPEVKEHSEQLQN